MSKGAPFGTGSREPSPDGLGPSGFDPSRDVRPGQPFYDRAEGMDALIWRLCEYRNDHCDRCPAADTIEGHGDCKRGCRALAEEMAALVMATCDSDGSPEGGDDSVGRRHRPDTTPSPDLLKELVEALGSVVAAIGDWARPTSANGMTSAGEGHPLCIAANEARPALLKARQAMGDDHA